MPFPPRASLPRQTLSSQAPERRAARVAWSVWATFWVVIAAPVVLAVWTQNLTTYLGFIPVLAAFATVGAVVVGRQPGNPIGWLCCAVALVSAVQMLATSYARYVFVDGRGWVAGGWVMGWLALWLGYVYGLVVTFLPLLFPTGRLPSRRWRPVAWAAASIIGGFCVVAAAMPGPDESVPGLPSNPLGIPAAEAALQQLEVLLGVGVAVVVILCAVSVVGRFRRARGVERQQLKWFTYGVALFALVFCVYFLSAGWWDRRVPLPISDAVFGVGYALVPVTTGIAILRYRLYDIDRVINRTLVYGLLTVLLGLGYAVGVIVFGELLGQARSNLAVAASTLAVAAVFQPVRRRIQQLVDRHFNRRRYDAAKTIEAFSVRLRHHIDLDTLTAELLAVVDQTMEPTQLSLWLRPPAGSTRGPAPSRWA